MFLLFLAPSHQSVCATTKIDKMHKVAAPQPNWGTFIKQLFRSSAKSAKKAPKAAKKVKTRGIHTNSYSTPNPIRSTAVLPVIPRENGSAIVRDLGITSGEYSFKVGNKTVYSEEDLLKAISDDILKKKTAAGQYTSRLEVRIEGLNSENRKVKIANYIASLSTQSPNLSEFDFSKVKTLTFSQSYTTFIIPRKITKLCNGVSLSRLQESEIKFEVKTSFAVRVKQVLANLFGQGGYLTQSRLDRALRDAGLESDVIITEYESYYFAHSENHQDSTPTI